MGLRARPVEDVVMGGRLPDPGFWAGRSVLVTGHTGFKGGWLCHWLKELGAEVHGLSQDPVSSPCMFDVSNVGAILASERRRDIGDLAALTSLVTASQPSVIFHMAAQSLVSRGYEDPVETWRTNVMGTVNLLQAVRSCPSVRSVVVVTTDKVYRNREWLFPYREEDDLGGLDPYSASKSAAEFVSESYRHSYFSGAELEGAVLATARAGNVIGGGDWSADRLVPDVLQALDGGVPLKLRSPRSTRPWQHVLDPLAGYLLLAESLQETLRGELPNEWNFGPDATANVSVMDVVNAIIDWTGSHAARVVADGNPSREAQLLALDSSRSRTILGWRPRWDFREALTRTLDWHRQWKYGGDMAYVTSSQIRDYVAGGGADG